METVSVDLGKGSSNLLTEHFIQGAEEAGHKVTVFDAARADLHPCMGCMGFGDAGNGVRCSKGRVEQPYGGNE